MNKLSRHEVLSLGITVFSMFFGAGNLIFPSMIGYLSGYNLPISIFFFSMSAVFLTFLGISAVAKAEGFYPIGSKVHPYFATAFTVIIYISIGPGLAIPRAGTMPFEIAIKPILSESNLNVGMLIYTFVFFGIAAWLSMKPNKLVDRMGKVLTPILLSLLIITSVLIFSKQAHVILPPKDPYRLHPATAAFINGYMTMDAIGSLTVGLVLSMIIQDIGITDKKVIRNTTYKVGAIAGILLFLVYILLALLGSHIAPNLANATNGVEVLIAVSYAAYGSYGPIVLGLIFTLACLTTCVGLITSCSKYFSELLHILSYEKFVILLSIISLIIGNFGLNQILAISSPILSAIYPIAITLILLTLLGDIPDITFKITTIVVGCISILSSINHAHSTCFKLISTLPLHNLQLSWVIPGIIIAIITTIYANLTLIED